MKSTEELIREATKIISKEHYSPFPKSSYNSKTGRHLRKIFISNCMEDVGTSFVSHMSGYVAPGQKRNHKPMPGGSISTSL